MRLTLRTLLAYRDGVLDPKDAAVLEAKIKDSSTAQQISKRIADEMQNRRLAPIPVDAREFGFEANMVAEFLDDTIPMETLPEMERKCLENNTLLSEIGSCHQILSRALSIPAPVSAALRQRIRDLPNNPMASTFTDSKGRMRRVDHPGANSGTESIPVGVTSAKSVRKSNMELRGSGIELNDGLGRQVPEYLIGSDRGWIKTAAFALCLLVALVFVGAMAIGPIDRVRDLLRKSELMADANASEKASGSEISEFNASPPVPPKKTVAMEANVDSNETEAGIVESSAGPPSPSMDLKKASDATLLSVAKNGGKEDAGSIPRSPAQATMNRMQWLPDTKASSESIVLKFCTTEIDSVASWRRMNPGEYVNVGERVVVPPTQRTEFRVEPGIRLLCAGENDLEPAKEAGIPKVILRSGRVLVFATPDAREIRLDCNGLEISIGFAATDGSCGLELQNQWSICTEEMVQAGKIESQSSVRLIGVEGALKYSFKHSAGAGGQGTMAVGQYVDWTNGAATATQELSEAPTWFRTSGRAIDQLAATDLQRALIGTVPGEIESELSELTNHRRGETAALAARTRMMLGRYDGLFEPAGVFNREKLHSHWPSLLAQLPQSLGRTEHRVELVDAIQTAAPNRLTSILSLLIPPSQEQLAAGADKILVEALSSPLMDERVLAIHQLVNITGKNLGYYPDKSQVDAIQQWRKLLGKNEIRYPEPTNLKSE